MVSLEYRGVYMRGKLDLRTLIADRFGTYEKLGEEVGLTKQGVSEVVNGRNCRRTTRYAIAKALGVEVEDIAWTEAAAA